MELLTFITVLCLAVSFMLPSSASDQVNVQKSIKHYGNSAVREAQFTLPLLSRKFKLEEYAIKKSFNDKDIRPNKKLMEASSDYNKQSEKEENVVQNHSAGKGTWREWVELESPNKSDYFTMDYAWVRRRRPIHNKHVPFVP